jgi:DnaJ family protein A protein 3
MDIFYIPETIPEENPHEDYAVSLVGEQLSREYVVQLSFEEAALGTTRYISLRVSGVCDKCAGSRAELGYGGNVCPYCEGSGQETVRTGHIVARRDCSYCNGEKIFIKFKCIECHGIGRKIFQRDQHIDIPPGTVHGQVLRFKIDPRQLGIEQGDEEKDYYLYVTVSVAESTVFSTDGLDLVSNLELSPSLALFGGKITVKGTNTSILKKLQNKNCFKKAKEFVFVSLS